MKKHSTQLSGINAIQKFNISNNFIKWADILYTNPILKMKNNGWLSKTCPMTKGIRQGCPLSALLYLFVAEILYIKINSNQHIKRIIAINNCEIKNIQHAVDLSLALKIETSMEHALNILHEFCENAGSKININKTECILLETLKKNLYNVFSVLKYKQSSQVSKNFYWPR